MSKEVILGITGSHVSEYFNNLMAAVSASQYKVLWRIFTSSGKLWCPDSDVVSGTVCELIDMGVINYEYQDDVRFLVVLPELKTKWQQLEKL